MTVTQKPIGQSVRRKEDDRLLRGQGAFSADIVLPGMVWAHFIRSPYAHARIRRIDASAALAQPGVLAVLTGADVHPRYHPLPNVVSVRDAQGNESAWATFYLMATDKARYAGEIVAVVVAKDAQAARDAADLVVVDYEPLPVVNDPEQGMRPNAPRIHEKAPNEQVAWYKSTPNVSQAFEEAEIILRHDFVNQRIHAVPMEPRAGIAHWDPATRFLTVWASIQGAHELRTQMTEVLGLREDSIRAIAPDVGGGFGAKHAGEVEYFLLAIASMKLGLPVKWVGTRSEEFIALSHARGKTSHFEVAATRDGRVTGVRLRHVDDLGAYPKGATPNIAKTSAIISTGVYAIPDIDLEVHAVYTNHTPEGAYRGYGRPEGVYVIERAMDMLASDLGMDPAEVRRKNLIPPDVFPYRTPGGDLFDSGDYQAALDKALEVSNYAALRQEQARLRQQGRYMGIGIACWVKSGGFGPSSLDPSSSMPEWGRVKVDRGGKVTVYTGSSPHGQGNHTTFAQVASEVLQVPIEDITVVHGDTAVVNYGMGTYASRAMVVGGTAVYNAAHKVLAKMRRLAAHNLGVSEQDVAFEGGVFTPKSKTAPRLTFAQVAQLSHAVLARPADMEMGLDESSFFQPSNLTFNYGAYIAVVEADPETGDVDLQKMFCVDDQGVIVNPMIVEAQVHGGAVQGIGQALYEHIVYDANGQLLSGSLMDYALPTAEMVPQFITATMETPSPMNPLGVKGMGEGPTTGAPPAVVNAVVDALAPFGVRDIQMPLTPERVWRAVQEAQGRQGQGQGGRR
jgi:carbon-monoxide dehydrogenase large subunit